MASGRRIRSRGDRLFQWSSVTLLTLFCITIIYPFLNQIAISFTTELEARALGHLRIIPAPEHLSWNAWRAVVNTPRIWISFYNTLWRVVVGTPLALIATYMMAYPLSKKYLVGRKLWIGIMVFTMFFSGGLIPMFLLIRALGLYDQRLVYVLPGLISAYHVIIVRNYLLNIPESLEESARIDGANELQILTSIIIPISKPIMATIALWIIVGHWNAWFDSLIYIRDPGKKVLQTILRDLIHFSQRGQTGSLGEGLMEDLLRAEGLIPPETVKSATLLIVTIPVLFAYPFLQRYFVKGITIGAVKG